MQAGEEPNELIEFICEIELLLIDEDRDADIVALLLQLLVL
jgi:hypothetical protein